MASRRGLEAVERLGEGATLKITNVRTAVVEANYDWTFTRIYTDEGITDLGEGSL
jgi:hypothetical protein